MSGWDWTWMSIAMVAFWVFVGGVVFFAIRAAQNTRRSEPEPREILAQRFARGEISEQEYDARRKVLAAR